VPANGATHLLAVRIEDRFEMHAVTLEGPGAHQSGSHVADANEHGGALGLLVNVPLQSGEHLGHGVTHVRLPDDAEAGHVLSDEGSVDVQFTSARIGRYVGLSVLLGSIDDFAVPGESTRQGA
jgi:hypothetical protein